MSSSDNRSDQRVSGVMRFRLKYPDVDTFMEKYAANVSKGGIFLVSRSPKPVGTLLRFEMLLTDSTPLVRGEGKVVWVKDFDPETPGKPHGMGVKFTRLDAASKALIDRIVALKLAQERAKVQQEPEPESEVESKAEPEPESKAEPEPEAKAEPKPEAKAEPEPEAEAEPKPEPSSVDRSQEGQPNALSDLEALLSGEVDSSRVKGTLARLKLKRQTMASVDLDNLLQSTQTQAPTSSSQRDPSASLAALLGRGTGTPAPQSRPKDTAVDDRQSPESQARALTAAADPDEAMARAPDSTGASEAPSAAELLAEALPADALPTQDFREPDDLLNGILHEDAAESSSVPPQTVESAELYAGNLDPDELVASAKALDELPTEAEDRDRQSPGEEASRPLVAAEENGLIELDDDLIEPVDDLDQVGVYRGEPIMMHGDALPPPPPPFPGLAGEADFGAPESPADPVGAEAFDEEVPTTLQSMGDELPAVADPSDTSHRKRELLGRRFEGEDEEVASELDAALNGIRTDVKDDPLYRPHPHLDDSMEPTPEEGHGWDPARRGTPGAPTARTGFPHSDGLAGEDDGLDALIADIQKEAQPSRPAPGRAMEFDLQQHPPILPEALPGEPGDSEDGFQGDSDVPGDQGPSGQEGEEGAGGDEGTDGDEGMGGDEGTDGDEGMGEDEGTDGDEGDSRQRKSGFFSRLFGR